MLNKQSYPHSEKFGGLGRQNFASVLKSLLLAVMVVGLGVMLGMLMTSSLNLLAVAAISCLAFVLLVLGAPLLGLIVVIIITPFNYYFAVIDLGRGIPNISPDRLVVTALVALMFFQAATHRRRLFYTHFYLAAALFIVAYYASFYNFHWTSSAAIQFLFDKWTLPVMIFFLVSHLVTSRRKLDLVLNMLLIIGVYSVLYMLYEQATGHIVFQYSDSYNKQFYGDTDLRITRGLYGTTTTYGNLFNLLLPIDVYYFLKVRSPGKKIWYLIVFGLLLGGVFLTYKRSVWIGMLLSFLVIQLFYPSFRKFFLVILLVTALGMFASWDAIVSSEAVSTRILDTEDWQDANGRTERWAAGMEYWERSPIFGSGFRSYIKGPYLQTENLYIHLLASAGLVAFIPFLVMLLIILKNSVAAFRQVGKNQSLFVDRGLVAVAWGGFTAYFFMAYFGSGVEGHVISNHTLFAILGAIVGSQIPLVARLTEKRKDYQVARI
jgi:O-antigen ligase